MSRPFEYRWVWEVPASPEQLWPLASDTNRFNRDTGLPPVEMTEEDGTRPNARRGLALRVLGLPLRWEETPFEWVRPRRFGVIRRYEKGPLREMRVRCHLEPLGEAHSRVIYEVTALPRGVYGLLTIPVQIGVISRIRFGNVFRRYAEVAGQAESGPIPSLKPPGIEPAGEARFRALEDESAGAGMANEVIRRLRALLAGGDDLSLARLRPYLLADLWELPRREVLSAFLRATRRGVLELRWDVLCPLCRGTKSDSPTLSELRSGKVHCETCRIDFGTDFDRSVELTFHPHPAAREIEAPDFCVAGPQVTPHVEVQLLVEAGDRRDFTPRLSEGSHRIRLFGGTPARGFRVEAGGADSVDLRLDPDAGWVGVPESVAPEADWVFENGRGEEVLVAIERTSWGDQAVTAADVSLLADFRDLFASEVFAAGEFASVGEVSLLFTDLRASTRLYRDVGDAPAFGRVMDHFEVIEGAVRSEGGTIVKTIGDAVMAAFHRPAPAIRAVDSAQRLLDGDGRDPALVLKAGLHRGACIAVTMDGRIDYFGTTVNVAARLGEMAEGGELVVSEAVGADPEAAALLGDAVDHRGEVRLRGLEEEPVHFLRMAIGTGGRPR